MVLNPRFFELARRVGRAFDAAKIDYAIGGALAFGIWGEPRGTKDIDVATYVQEEELERVFVALQGAGADVERAACRWQLNRWGHFEVDLEMVRIDVYLPDFPLYDWAHGRRQCVTSGDYWLWFWSAEDTLLFRLLFFREKDKVDIKTLMDVQRNALDVDYIRKALREIFADEERSSWFEDAAHELLKR